MKTTNTTIVLFIILFVLCGFTSTTAQRSQLALAKVESTPAIMGTSRQVSSEDKNFGCLNGFHIKINGGSVKCSKPNGGDKPMLKLKISGSSGYELFTVGTFGLSKIGEYDSPPKVEYEKVDGSGNSSGYQEIDLNDLLGDFPNAQTQPDDNYTCDFYANSNRVGVNCKRCSFAGTTVAKQLKFEGTLKYVIGGVVATGGLLTGNGWAIVIGAGFFIAGTTDFIRAQTLESIDCNSFRQTNYYQSITQSEVVGLNVYPNPVIQKTTLQIHLPQAEDLTVEVFDLNGVAQKTLLIGKRFPAGNNQIPLSLGLLAPGKYLIKVTSSLSNIKITQPIIKQ
ncbi:T9SS type A sorting domain-containing protein [uncultured Microscilla sp.]|uniref:T9SS type A sorting domain-containing protein n=1 Tax=uncultured Microscilla sp. TaxID=432653 RepID=UPI002621732B|nr:T9SS type A sorting domain-containing protein [uncultured Microscilla sp.]